MGSLTLNRPSVQGRTADEKIESLRRSITSMVDELNLADWSAYRTLKDIGAAIDAGALQSRAEELSAELSGYAALRALVVKTADYAVQNSETFKLQLRSDYVAVSDFGKYWQNATMTVNGTSFGIEQLFEYSEGVNNKYTVNSKQYVKTGLLYYNGVTPVYGVGVGNIATAVSGGNTVIDKTQGELVVVTPDRIGFWQTGSEIAYITSKKICFPSSTLVAYDAQLSGTITAAAGSKIGPWTVADAAIWRGSQIFGEAGGVYFGTSGLSVSDVFTVDADGKLAATNATISGEIVAQHGFLGNWEFDGDEITGGSNTSLQVAGITISNGYVVGDRCIRADTLCGLDLIRTVVWAINASADGGMGFYIPMVAAGSDGVPDRDFTFINLCDLINYIVNNYTSGSANLNTGGTVNPPETGGTTGNVCLYSGGSGENQIKTRASIGQNTGTNTGDFCVTGDYYNYDQTMTVVDPTYGSGIRVWASQMVERSVKSGSSISGKTGRSWTNGSFFVKNGSFTRYTGVTLQN